MSLSSPRVRLALFVGLLTVARLMFAATIHLTEDEAYYRLWAQSLQLGYYDHPPMIAWWIWVGEKIAGEHALGVRLLPVLAASLTSGLVYDLALQVEADERTAFRAAVWYNATLLVGLGGILATPDAPATLFWAAAACCLARAARTDAWRWWLATGVAAGLACLSKYSAMFLAPGAALWLLWRRGPVAVLNPRAWMAALIAAWLFALNVAWNARHGWVSFDKQFGRVLPSRFSPRYLAEFVGGQAVLLNPLITVFLVLGLIALWRSRRMLAQQTVGLLLALCLPFAAYLCLHSLHDRVQAHWPAPMYPALVILASLGAAGLSGRGLGRLKSVVAPLGLAVSFAALLHLALPATDVFGRRDPARDLHGWPEFAKRIEAIRLDQGALWVGAVSYGTTAQLQADHKVAAPVVQLSERPRYPPGNHSWRADVTRPGLLVDLRRRVALDDLRQCFEIVTPLGVINRVAPASDDEAYSVVLVSGPRGSLLENGCWQSKSPADDQAVQRRSAERSRAAAK